MALSVIKVASGGLAVSQASANFGYPCVLSTNGFGLAITPVASGGWPIADATPGGGIFSGIQLSGTTFPAGSAAGITIGTLSVTGGTGTYTYSLTNSAGNKVALSEATAFLARTSGLDTTHVNAYTALIDGLVADGVWSKLDVLRIYATQNSTTALLNLKSSSYGGTIHGSPTFTTDRGFTGVAASTTVYIDSGFNPVTASSPQYTQNSGHISAWNLTNTASGASDGYVLGLFKSGSATGIIPRYSSSNSTFFRVNTAAAPAGTVGAIWTGHYIANRSASNATQGYRNGSSIMTSADASGAPFNGNFYELSENNAGVSDWGGAFQVSALSIGSSLSSTDASNFYNRLRTYMTAVGVP